MAQTYRQPNKKPTRKVAAATLGVLLANVLSQIVVNVFPEVLAGVDPMDLSGIATTAAALIFGWTVKERVGS